jgi:hypothetical protein
MLFIIIQVFKTFNDSRSSRIEAAKNSFNKLLDDIAIAVEFEPFIEKDTFIIKPVVGACKSGFLKFSVENGNPDIFIQKIRDHISNSVFTSWIVQPYIPQFTKSEYKVFIGGRDKCVVYQPVYDNNSVVMVYCPKNKIYSDIFGSDSCSLSSDYNTATKVWTNEALYNNISKFADKCKASFCGGVDMEALDIICRVDIVCLFKEVGRDFEQIQYDTKNPFMVLNEMDNLWSASFLLDMENPFRDSLRPPIVPNGTRDPVQKWWVNELCRTIAKHLLTPATFQAINWGARPGTLGRKRKVSTDDDE